MRVTARTTWGVAVVACLGVLPLAGCGGSGDANAAASQDPVSRALQSVYPSSGSSASKASPSASASRGASSVADPFVVPEKAKAHTREGAVEFVKFYWNAMGELERAPSSTDMRQFVTTRCKTCQEQEKVLADLRRTGDTLHVKNARIEGAIQVDPKSLRDQVVVRFTQADDGGERKDRSGRVVRKVESTRVDTVVRTYWVDGGWLIDEIGSDGQ